MSSQLDLLMRPVSPGQLSSAGDSPASHSVTPGSKEAVTMTVTSGRNLCGLLPISGPIGSLARMCRESSEWNSTIVLLIWKMQDTPCKRSIFRLVPSVPYIGEPGSSLWPTPMNQDCHKPVRTLCPSEITLDHGVMLVAAVGDSLRDAPMRLWPTPNAPRAHDSDETAGKFYETKNQMDLVKAVHLWPTPRAHEAGGYQRDGGKKDGTQRPTLSGAVRLWPTPTSRDHKDVGDLGKGGGRMKTDLHGKLGRAVTPSKESGSLNPRWVEWLMGFPDGWTALDASETPSCRSKSTRSSKRSRISKTE